MLFWRIAPYLSIKISNFTMKSCFQKHNFNVKCVYIKAMFSKYNLSAKCVVTKIMFWKHDYHAKIEILMLKLMFSTQNSQRTNFLKKKKKTDFLKIFYHKVIFNNYNKILLFS